MAKNTFVAEATFKPVSTDLTIKADSVLTNPIGKDGV